VRRAILALKPQAVQINVENGDKILHLLAFLALTLIPVITFDKTRNIAFGVLFVAAIAVGIEVMQLYVPTRYADIIDVAYDGIGIALGIIIGWSLRGVYQAILPTAYVEAYIDK